MDRYSLSQSNACIHLAVKSETALIIMTDLWHQNNVFMFELTTACVLGCPENNTEILIVIFTTNTGIKYVFLIYRDLANHKQTNKHS